MNNLDFGVIGNCKSVALISKTASIDWCCLPEFNSSSVFAKILDKNKGGSFEFLVDDKYTISQEYINKTNILITSFDNGKDRFEVIDFMPRYITLNRQYYSPPDIIRYIRLVKGKPVFKVKYAPKLLFASAPTRTIIKNDYLKSYTTRGTYNSIYLYTDFDKEKVKNQEDIELKKNSFFLLSYNEKILEQDIERINLKYQRTKVYWLDWSVKTKVFKEYNKEISRSALVLKLLSYDKTGAVLAAATTSLPETIGGIRNWDYRFCWLRDSSMVIKVLTLLGHQNVAKRFLKFIIDIIPYKNDKIQIMYGINRERKLKEEILGHLEGYMGSSPVRVGNDAYKQKQNDIFGILMDVLYQQFSVYETSLEDSETLWTITRSIVKIVEKNWKKPDRGIWEIRTQLKHFTFSKVLSWVAIDRAIKIAKLIKKEEYIKPWTRLLNRIRKDIEEKAWNEERQAYAQAYGSDDLDAANLLMESYGFIDANNSRYVKTVHETGKELCYNGLMYRYKNEDDFGLPSSSFTICTFWYINSLQKIGEHDKAKSMFNTLLGYSNHLGLFSEDIDFKTKQLLGNFPQAYSHLALIETAINISNGKTIKTENIVEAMKK